MSSYVIHSVEAKALVDKAMVNGNSYAYCWDAPSKNKGPLEVVTVIDTLTGNVQVSIFKNGKLTSQTNHP